MKHVSVTILLAVTLALLALSAAAVPPSPEALKKWRAEGVLAEKLAPLKAFKEAGGCSPALHVPFKDARKARLSNLALGTEVTDTVNVIVILVDFDDNLYTGGTAAAQPYQFDSMLFSHPDTHPANMVNSNGSMTQFYMENSYGTFFIKGDIYGWYRMPHDYAHYVSIDNGMSRGDDLTLDAVNVANLDGADFSRYDSDNDGWCDGLIIIHAGPGAETGNYGIWSHKGNMSAINYDGVWLSDYTMNPEEFGNSGMNSIGVFAHEYGHFLGLPDYYDVDGSEGNISEGLGDWSLMASGSYNGGSRSPAHLDAWCRIDVGFATTTAVSDNIFQAEIPCVEHNPVIYRLQNSDAAPYEYWLVENRQPYGFDAALPGHGLVIYHYDAMAPSQNRIHYWYRLAVEQADGANDLAFTSGNQGDLGDAWPGWTNNRDFHDRSIPSSRANEFGYSSGASTEVAVWDISDPDSVMYANLDVSYSHPWVELALTDGATFDDSAEGNGNGDIEAGEEIHLTLMVTNYMRTSYNARVTVSSNNPNVTFLDNQAHLGDIMGHFHILNAEPVRFVISPSQVPAIDTFWIEVVSDSLAGVGGTDEFLQQFPLEVSLGNTQVLVVDDDGGTGYAGKPFDQVYTDALYSLAIPHESWSIADSGTPQVSSLVNYPMVFWCNGDNTGNVISSGDVTAMQGYLDAGGKLLVSGIESAVDIDSVNSNVLPDYFGATLSGSTGFAPVLFKINGGPMTGPSQYRYESVAPNTPLHLMSLNGDGEGLLRLMSASDIVGIANGTTQKAVLLNFPLGYLMDNESGYGNKWEMIDAIIDFFGGIQPIPTDVDGGTKAAVPRDFALAQNYPNPFNPTTTISYTLGPTAGRPPLTRLHIYNALGQKITTLVNQSQLPGHYSVVWDGRSAGGNPVASGVYFYRLSRGEESQTRKMVLLK